MEAKLYVVVNIGCLECGVSSNIVGCYDNKERAENIAERCKGLFSERQGGHSVFKVFELDELNATLDEYCDDYGTKLVKQESYCPNIKCDPQPIT